MNDSVHPTKLLITRRIQDKIVADRISGRKLAEKIDMHNQQLIRVTNGENYTIDTLVRVLDGLGLEIAIVQKKELL